MVYLIGSLRNPGVPAMGNQLRSLGFDVFDDWYSAGPEADDKWKDYEQRRGRTYQEALGGSAAKAVFEFDYKNLERATSVVLVLPAGKSGHLELGWALGRGKSGFIYLDSPERWDVMYQFATGVTTDFTELVRWLEQHEKASLQRDPRGLSSGGTSLPRWERRPEQESQTHGRADNTYRIRGAGIFGGGEQPNQEQTGCFPADGPEPGDASVAKNGVFASPDWFDRGPTG